MKIKKPEITEGEWQFTNWEDENYPCGNRLSVTEIRRGYAIALSPKYWHSNPNTENNFKLLASAPDLLDALIDSTASLIERIENKGLDPMEDYCVKQNIKALKKAGCSFTDELSSDSEGCKIKPVKEKV